MYKPGAQKILIMVSFEAGRGTGHLVRSSLLVKELRALGRAAFLHIRSPGGHSLAESGLLDECAGFLVNERELLAGGWSLIVFDRFATPLDEFTAYPFATLVALDEGGALRPCFDFCFDLLPNLSSLPPPNAVRPDWLPLPRARRPAFGGFDARAPEFSVLVSFGGEDAAGLGARTAAELRSALPRARITLVSAAQNAPVAGVTVLPRVNNLRETLAGYDAVVTHFGLTAFEAIYARCTVVVRAPSPLHKKLSRAAGFAFALRNRAGTRAFWQTATAHSAAVAARFFPTCTPEAEPHARGGPADATVGGTLAAQLAAAQPVIFRQCPVCGLFIPCSRKVAARFAEQTFVECPHCLMVIQNRMRPAPLDYDDERYFFELYQKQYGKTYLEDIPNLIARAQPRLRVIKTLLARAGHAGTPRLLDIGCAYGAFLSAAGAEGFVAEGIDPSRAAAEYIRTRLGLSARVGFFPDDYDCSGKNAAGFDCLTLWFVIEHLTDVPAALHAAFNLLRPGGVLAFSTPSLNGISAKKSLKAFLAASPADHWAVWKPAACRRLLAGFGFRVQKIRITGHHPERFPGAGRVRPGSFLFGLLNGLSKALGLGDTFEVYAVKPTVSPKI